MPDPALEEAIREAYASCPSNAIPLHTMELRHPAFMDDQGNPTAVRVVRNYEDEVTWRERGGPEVAALLNTMTEEARGRVGLVARLEPDAPVNAGQMVAFIALAFDFQLPEVSSAPVPELTVTMDNVGRELMEPLEAAATSLVRIEVTYRPYLDIDLDGPQMGPAADHDPGPRQLHRHPDHRSRPDFPDRQQGLSLAHLYPALLSGAGRLT